MRALRSCDFCDAEAVGAFEVVPPELEPTEAEQRRVVLCGDCKAQLETLLEPLLARAGAASTDVGGDSDAGSDSDTDAESGSGTVVAAADEPSRNRRRTTSPDATVSDADSSATADGPDDAASDTPASEPESGITFETDEAGIADSSAGGSEQNANAAVESSDDTDDHEKTNRTAAQPSESASDSTSSDASETADANDASAGSPPRAYGKVIRLLRNREFPVDRTAAAELAAGAYDLEPAAVDAIIDHAIENDEFVERNGALHRA